MAKFVDDASGWSLRRTAAGAVLAIAALVGVVRALALAANAVGVDPTVAHYVFLAMPLLVLLTILARLGSDERFGHERYLVAADRRTLARDFGAGIVVAYVGVPTYLVAQSFVPAPFDVLYGLLAGISIGATATIGLVREYYDENPYPYYFALLDRLER